MHPMKSLWKTMVARLALARAQKPRHEFLEGVAFERRRVLHLLENMQPTRDPASGLDLTITLYWAEGWALARETAVALVAHRPLPAGFYDGPPESVGHFSYVGQIGLAAPEPLAELNVVDGPGEHEMGSSAGDARCNFCDGPMPCYCPKPTNWDGADDDSDIPPAAGHGRNY